MSRIGDAALISGLSMASLGIVAQNAPSEAFLGWKTAISYLSLAVFLGSALTAAYPGSIAIYSWQMYFGVAMSGALMLMNYQNILKDAKIEPEYDPLSHSIDIYMNFISMFVFMMMILSANENTNQNETKN